jgi:cytochrome c556
MKSVFKKIVLFTLCFSLAFVLFAEPKSTGITDSDVKNYAKNFDSIQKELDKLGVLTDDNGIQATAKQKADIDKILQKYGITGANCIEKFGMISACATVLVGESELDAESIALMKSFGMDPMAELKKYTNSKDFEVVKANAKAVVNAVKNADTSSYSGSSSSSASDSDDYSYGDADLADLYSRLSVSAQDVASQSSDLSIDEMNDY